MQCELMLHALLHRLAINDLTPLLALSHTKHAVTVVIHAIC